MKLKKCVGSRGRYLILYIYYPAPTVGIDLMVPTLTVDSSTWDDELKDLPGEAPTLSRTDTWAHGASFFDAPPAQTLAGELCSAAEDVLLGIRIREECQQVLSTGKKQRTSSQTARDLLWPLLVKYKDRPSTPTMTTDLCMYYELVMEAKKHATAAQLDAIISFGRRVFFYDDNKSVLRYLRAMKEILADVTLPGEWRTRLHMGAGLMAECNRQANERIDLKMRSPIDIDSQLIERIATACVLDPHSVCRRRASLFVCQWIGVQLAIGCRMCEVVLPSVTFEPVTDLERSIPSRFVKQIGRSKDPTGVYANAALIKEIVGGLTCTDIISAIANIRKSIASTLEGIPAGKLAEVVNRKYNATAVCIVKRLFPSQAEHCLRMKLGFGTHFLRAAWVNYLWEHHRSDSDCPTQTRFIAEHLGHDMSFMSAKNYECVRVRRSASHGRPANAPLAVQAGREGCAGISTISDRWSEDVPFATVDPEEEECSSPKRRRFT